MEWFHGTINKSINKSKCKHSVQPSVPSDRDMMFTSEHPNYPCCHADLSTVLGSTHRQIDIAENHGIRPSRTLRRYPPGEEGWTIVVKGCELQTAEGSWKGMRKMRIVITCFYLSIVQRVKNSISSTMLLIIFKTS